LGTVAENGVRYPFPSTSMFVVRWKHGQGISRRCGRYGVRYMESNAKRAGLVNANGGLDITDPIFLLNALFKDVPPPPCDDAADAKNDGELDISDAIKMLLYMFDNVTELPAPGALEPGRDSTPDSLGCIREN